MLLEIFTEKSMSKCQIRATVNSVAVTVNSAANLNSVAGFSVEQKATLLTVDSTG